MSTRSSLHDYRLVLRSTKSLSLATGMACFSSTPEPSSEFPVDVVPTRGQPAKDEEKDSADKAESMKAKKKGDKKSGADSSDKPKSKKKKKKGAKKPDADGKAKSKKKRKSIKKKNEAGETLFEGQCLDRQMHQPKIPYPAWDYDWDGKETEESSLETLSTLAGLKESRRTGVTRHIILIRHGQTDESSPDDKDKRLTPLGRRQAVKTGSRLVGMLNGGMMMLKDKTGNMKIPAPRGNSGPCRVKAVYVSDMIRAKETAAIIAKYLPPGVNVGTPDPLLNEAIPSPMIPARPDIRNEVKKVDDNHDRIEKAFQKYFYRHSSGSDDESSASDSSDEEDDESAGANGGEEPPMQHEFELLVGHGNVIRYFICRALQLPPECWLRIAVFNCSISYLVIQPNGYVQVRLLGDTGHLSYKETTYSGYHGYQW